MNKIEVVFHLGAAVIKIDKMPRIPRAIAVACPEAKQVWSEIDYLGVQADGIVFYIHDGEEDTIFPAWAATKIARVVQNYILPLFGPLLEGQVMSSVFADILQPQQPAEPPADERPLTVVLTTGEELNALLREQGVTMRAEGGDVVCDLTPQVRIKNAAQIAESTFVQVKVFAQRVEVAPLAERFSGDLTDALVLELDELKAWAAKIFR